jgi:4'-phosphopantetheinyl transferase EntD
VPQELTVLARCVEKRRREFIAGRVCAHHALARFSLEGVPIPCGRHREPLWPAGIVGSITHCPGYCAAAVASARTIRAIGIDAERNVPLSPGIEELVCTERERRWLRSPPYCDKVNWATLFFSAKESLYKAWFPATHRWLDFTDVELTIHPRQGSFTARLFVPVPAVFSGSAPFQRALRGTR